MPPTPCPESGTGAGPAPVAAAAPVVAAAPTGRWRFIRPLPADQRPRRLLQLLIGLVLFGFSLALMVRAGLGLGPWDVFHQGVTFHVPYVTIGLVSILTSLVVLVGWIPLRERPGLGTLANAVVVGLVVDASLWLLPQFRHPGDPLTPARLVVPVVAMVASVVLNGLAGALYIGAGLGPGPRDGLMTGLVRSTGRPVALVRGGIELAVLATGWLLGGTVGLGTVLYAAAMGPLMHVMMPWFEIGRVAQRRGRAQ